MGISINDLFGQPAEPQKAPSINDLFAEQDEQNRRQESARIRALVNGVKHSPEQATEAIALSRQTGVPADVALRNLDPLRKMQSVEEFDADTFVRQNPITSRWLQADPINPAIARDDLENLGGFEQLVGRWRMPSASDVLAGLAGGPTAGGRIFQQVQRGRVQAAYGAGQAGIALTELYGTALAAERRTPEFQAKAEALRAQQDIAIPEADDFLERSLVSVARGFAPSMAYVAGESIEGYVGGFAGGAALGALAGPGALATGAVGGAAGARIKGYNAYRILMTGELAQRLDAAQDAYGNPIPDDVKDAVSLTGGAGLALLGMYGFDKAVGLVAGASRRIAAQAVGNATATALTSATGRRVALEVGKTVLGTTVLETAQEVTEQAGLIAGESVARMIAGGGLDAGDFGPVENVTAELLETAIETAYGAWILGGVGGVSAGVLGLQRINQAKQDGAVIETLAEQAGMSKLRQRDPAKYEELVRLQTPESLERVGIEAERLTVLLQEQSIPLAQFAQVAGITEQDVVDALARGGDVYIPTPNLLARLVGTPVFDAMKMDLRIRPDGLTQREADEQAKTLEADQQAVEAEVQEIIKSGTTDVSGQRVIDDITAQITAAAAEAPKAKRFTPENIEATARAIAAFFITTGKREGIDAYELYASREYRIVGRGTAEPLYDALVEAQKLEKSGKNPKRLAALRATIATLRGTLPAAEVRRMEQAAFHGTPYTFDKFSLSAIGTGEGAQAYGWGLYFAESQDVAEGYQKNLSDRTILVDGVTPSTMRDGDRKALESIADFGYDEALARAIRTLDAYEDEFGSDPATITGSTERSLRDLRDQIATIRQYAGKDVQFKNRGALYRVDIPDEAVARMLDWDKPLSEQAPEVRDALSRMFRETFLPDVLTSVRALGGMEKFSTGGEFYRSLAESLGPDGQEAASKMLLAAGIPGIKYLDAGSRGTGDGTRNLVVFDENLVTITHRNGEPVTAQERTDFLAQEAMGSAVSTRFPTAMKATEDPLRSLLSIGLAEMQMDPKAFAKNVAAVAQYPNMRVVENETPEQTAERFIQHVSDNLLWLHDQVDEATRQRSKLWYDGARRIAERWSGEYGLTVEQVSGVMAALSPQKDWYQNVSLARRVLDTMSKQANFRWTPEMTETAARLNAEGKPLLDPEYVALIKGKVLGQLQDAREIAWFVRVYDETYNDRQFPTITPEGGEAGPVLTAKGQNAKVAWGSYNEIAKAVAMALEPSLANISMNLGGAHKVRNFYNNIVDPNSPRGEVTIDTHAVAAGLLRPLSGKSIEVKHNLQGGLGASNSSIFGVVGTYGLFAEAYRRAAVARNVLPREMQSITWEAIRGLFPAEFKDAKNVEAVDAVWQRYRDGTLTLDAVRADVAGLAGGIANPTWYGSDAGLDAGLESPADARGVPEGVGAVGAARPRVRGDVATAVPKQRPGIGGGFARAREKVRAGLGPNILFQQAGEFAGAALPETLEVDGVSRPTRNSTGQPIHPTEEGIRNFWRWATTDGRTPFADENGRPIRLYHGTKDASFDEFNPLAGKFKTANTGAFLTTNPAAADTYTGVGGAMYPLYVRVRNNVELDAGGRGWERLPRSADVSMPDGSVSTIAEFSEKDTFTTDDLARYARTINADAVVVSNVVDRGPKGAFATPESVDPSTIVVVFDGADIKSAIGNTGEFGPTANILRQGAERPNAYFLRTERVIGLMAGTNLSSVMHEMSHEYLATLEFVVRDPDAPAWLRQDFETAMTAIGIAAEERDAFTQYLRTGITADAKMTKRFVDAEEKWARSFESYLEKGEAPSRDLLRAFATFRVWFGQVYRMFKQMLIPVSPELRGVFDRMLATDEEIAEYRQFPEAMPLFMQKPDGMTDAQWTEYTKGFRTRDALAGTALVKRILTETRAAVSQDWENKRIDIEQAIREELSLDPVVRAVEFMRVGVDGEPMKLNRALLNPIAPDLWKSFPKGTTSADGTMTLDALALKFGFPDALTLSSALMNYEEVDSVVAKRVAETFRREYGDLLGDSTAMADAVSEATHRAETDEPLIRELKALGVQLGMRVVDKPALVQIAREMLAEMRVSEIQPNRYELAEAKEARAAEAALRSGNTERAAFHKRRQLLNRILVRESRMAVAEAEKTRTFALRMAKEPAQATLGKAGEAFTDAMNAILTEYEFARVSRKQIGRREALALYVADVQARGGVPMLSDAILADAAIVNYRALPLRELAAVDAAMRQIWHHAKTVNTIASEGRKISLEQAGDEIVASLEKHRPQVEMNVDGTPVSLGASRDLVRAIDAWHVPPTFLFRWLDGDNYGATWRLFFAPIQAAENAELSRMREAAKRVADIEKMVTVPPYLLDVGQSYDGIRSKLTKRQVLALALNWGNASSRTAVDEARTGDGYPQFGSAAAIEAMFAQVLTEQDWKYVTARWDYANEFWPEISDLERRMTGVVPDKIEATPFMIQTKDGKTISVRGGYYPLAYDRKLGLGRGLAKLGTDAVETDLGSIAFAGGARAQTLHGWTNNRKGSAGKPIDLSLGVWNSHIQSVIHDLTHREAVRDVYALWQREDVRVALVRAAGQPYYDSIKAWLVRVANPLATVGDTSYLEKVLQMARVGTTAVNLGLKFSSGVAQTLGYVQSVEAIGPKWMTVGMREFMPDMARAMAGQSTPAVDFVIASSPMMANRKFNYNRDVADYARSKFGKMTDLDAFNFWFIGMMDGMVSFPTWIGAYRKAMASNGNDHEAAVRVADDTVESSQGAGSAKDLARIQGGSELRKLATMHYTAFSRMFGQLRRATTNKQMGKYGTPRFLAAMTALWFGQVVLGELLGGRWPGEEEDATEYWMWKILSFPASFFIGIRDLVNAIGPNGYDYKFSPAEAAFDRTAKAVNAVYRETLGDLFYGADREMTEAEARALIEAPGYWFRLPTKAVWQYGDYFMDWAQGEVAPTDPVQLFRGLLLNQR